MGLEKLSPEAKSPSDYEKQKLLALIEIIQKSELVAKIEVVWMTELEHMAQSMSASSSLTAVGAKYGS